MEKLVVNKSSLVSVADAIREKSSVSESLEFPQGFVDAVDAIESGDTAELENLIDQSGVLDSTDGTATEKVEQLIDKAEWENVWYKQTERLTNASALFMSLETETIPRSNLINQSQFISFCNKASIKYIDYYLNTVKGTTFTDCFANTQNLKRIVGINTAKATLVTRLFYNSVIEEIDEPFDFSSLGSAKNQDSCFYANSLVKIRFVAESIKWSIAFSSPYLSAESIQSIFDGLAFVTTAQTLTLHANAKILQSQVDSANAKGWTVAGGTVVSEEEYYG